MEHPICILAAVREELSGILRQMAVSSKQKIGRADLWSGAWQGRPLLLVRTGVGKRCAFLALSDVLAAHTPGLIVSIGYAGGTDPALRVGDLLLAEKILEPPPGEFHAGGMQAPAQEFEVDASLAARFAEVAPPEGAALHRGALLTVGEVVTEPEKKQALGARYDACALDMETAALARLAREKDIPFLSLRAISDAADDALMDVSPFLEEDGEVSRLKAGWYVLTHPSAIGPLRNLQVVARQATARLTEFLAAALKNLPRE